MFSSGQFESEFTAFLECVDCGLYELVDAWHDPEMSPAYGFTCGCGADNRFDTEDADDDY